MRSPPSGRAKPRRPSPDWDPGPQRDCQDEAFRSTARLSEKPLDIVAPLLLAVICALRMTARAIPETRPAKGRSAGPRSHKFTCG